MTKYIHSVKRDVDPSRHFNDALPPPRRLRAAFTVRYLSGSLVAER
jgi:hypothetical protein